MRAGPLWARWGADRGRGGPRGGGGDRRRRGAASARWNRGGAGGGGRPFLVTRRLGPNGARFRVLARLPKNKSRLQLEQLRDRRLERQNGHRLLRVIRFHGDRLLLEAGAIADAEGRGDLAFLARRNVIFLQRRHRATAGSARR